MLMIQQLNQSLHIPYALMTLIALVHFLYFYYIVIDYMLQNKFPFQYRTIKPVSSLLKSEKWAPVAASTKHTPGELLQAN